MKDLLLTMLFAPAALAVNIDQYNVLWDSQSNSSSDSMPLAGGNLGLNVWAENNDLLFLIGSPNCMDERGMQVKMGLVRLRFDQPVFARDFRQELRLQESEIIVSGRSPSGGKGGPTPSIFRIRVGTGGSDPVTTGRREVI